MEAQNEQRPADATTTEGENAAPVNALERRLDLSVSVADVTQKTNERLKKMSHKVKMPGFRPGKVPFHMVQQMHGAGVYNEVLADAFDAAFVEAVQAGKLRVAGQPRLEAKTDGESDGENIVCTAIFEVYPEITLGSVAGVEIEKPTLTVGDEEIDQTLDVLRRQRMRFVDVDRAAANGDRVVIDFLGKKDGEPFEGGKGDDYPFVIGQGMMLPDFESNVIGLGKGEEKTFALTFPPEYFAKDLAGKEVEFSVTVKTVQGPQLPELDSDFARQMGVADGDLEKLRAEVGENLKREVRNRIDGRVKTQVMDALLSVNTIDLPTALVDMEVKRMMEATRQDMVNRGMQVKNFPMQPQWFGEQARRRVALGLILAEVVNQEKLEVKPEQVRALVEEVAASYEKPEEIIKWYYSQPQRLANVEGLALEDNVVSWVLSQAKVSEKPIALNVLMGQGEGADAANGEATA